MAFTYVVGEGFKRTVTDSKPIYRFSINGIVELPELTVLDSPRINDESYEISKVAVSAKEVGTADYRFVIKSYDMDGDNEITHVDDTVSITEKGIEELTITQVSVGADRTLELSVQSLSGTHSKDITIMIF